METIKGKYVILEKIEDKVFEGFHPNGINKGHQLKGFCMDEPIIGQSVFLFITDQFQTTPQAWTSRLEKIDYDNMILETKNSKYSITVDENEKGITKEDLQQAFFKSKSQEG